MEPTSAALDQDEPVIAASPSAGAPGAALPSSAAPGAAAAAAVLDGMGERPLHEHPEAYARIHAELHGALASIDDA